MLQHNCVVVPSFGGFVAQRVGAQLDPVRGIMTPPRKAVMFNRQLINNDGLLIATFAHHSKTDFAAAQAAVNELVSEWETRLRNGERISLDRIGFLFLDAERNLCFEQDKFYNLLLESYGLGPVRFVSASDVEAKTNHAAVQELVKEVTDTPVVEFETKQPVILTVVEKEEDSEKPVLTIAVPKKGSNAWKYIAAAALLPVAFYSFWIPMKTDVLESGMLSLSDFNPFRKSSEAVYKPKRTVYSAPANRNDNQLEGMPDEVETYSYKLDEDNYIPVKVKESAPEVAPETVAPAPAKPRPVVNAPGGSYVVVGCFGSTANAEKMVSELKAKGYDAQMLPAGSMTRVVAGKGSEFNALQPRLTADGYKPWLLK